MVEEESPTVREEFDAAAADAPEEAEAFAGRVGFGQGRRHPRRGKRRGRQPRFAAHGAGLGREIRRGPIRGLRPGLLLRDEVRHVPEADRAVPPGGSQFPAPRGERDRPDPVVVAVAGESVEFLQPLGGPQHDTPVRPAGRQDAAVGRPRDGTGFVLAAHGPAEQGASRGGEHAQQGRPGIRHDGERRRVRRPADFLRVIDPVLSRTRPRRRLEDQYVAPVGPLRDGGQLPPVGRPGEDPGVAGGEFLNHGRPGRSGRPAGGTRTPPRRSRRGGPNPATTPPRNGCARIRPCELLVPVGLPPESASQTRIVPSNPAEARRVPSGDHATTRTVLVSPVACQTAVPSRATTRNSPSFPATASRATQRPTHGLEVGRPESEHGPFAGVLRRCRIGHASPPRRVNPTARRRVTPIRHGPRPCSASPRPAVFRSGGSTPCRWRTKKSCSRRCAVGAAAAVAQPGHHEQVEVLVRLDQRVDHAAASIPAARSCPARRRSAAACPAAGGRCRRSS